jgi:hypothetical protein
VSRIMLGGRLDGWVVGPGSKLVRGWGSDEPNSAAEIAGSDRRGKDIMIPGGCGSGRASGGKMRERERSRKECKCRSDEEVNVRRGRFGLGRYGFQVGLVAVTCGGLRKVFPKRSCM